MLKTLILEPMPERFHYEIEARGWQQWFHRIEDVTLSEESNSGWQAIVIRTKTRFDRSMFRLFPDLKLLIRAGTGFDNIELDATGDVVVCNTPDANAIAAAEHTLSFILALIKHLNLAGRNVLSERWRDGMPYNPEISELRVLLVGVGRVGGRVARCLRMLGAKVKGVDPYLTAKERIERGIEFVGYEDGLKWCNMLSFHCPLTDETRNYFVEKHLDITEESIWLVNTARGPIVSWKAVEKGVKSGKILGAALDVFDPEPWIPPAIANDPRIMLSPHTGARTGAAQERLALETIHVWQEFAFHGRVINKV